MTSDPDVLTKTIALANKHNIPLWEVYGAHIQYLFEFETDDSVLRKLIFENSLISYCKEHSLQLVALTDDVILSNLDGRDHRKLLMYFSFLCEILDDSPKRKETEIHKSILQQVVNISSSSSFDYKPLIAFSFNSLQAIASIHKRVTGDDFFQIMLSLSQIKTDITSPSTVYRAWAYLRFFGGKDSRKVLSSSDWIKRFVLVILFYCFCLQ